MRAIRQVVLGVVVAAAVCWPGNASEAQLVLYDDFKGRLLDPSRWSGFNSSGPSSGPTTEAVRQIKNGQLELHVHQYGSDDFDGGRTIGSVIANVTDPAPITTLQAAVRIADAEAELCPGWAGSTVVGGIHGRFFNDGTSAGPGDQTGDVQAMLDKTLDAFDGSLFRAHYFRCNNASCSDRSDFGESFQDLTWKTGETNVMTLAWDHTNNRFSYSVRRGKTTTTLTLAYTVNDSNPPVVNFKSLLAQGFAANCNGSRKHAFIDVLFGNVMINP